MAGVRAGGSYTGPKDHMCPLIESRQLGPTWHAQLSVSTRSAHDLCSSHVGGIMNFTQQRPLLPSALHRSQVFNPRCKGLQICSRNIKRHCCDAGYALPICFTNRQMGSFPK